MTDPSNPLSQIAGFTLLMTILWAATLGFISWDTQRRKNSGQNVHGMLWMVVGAVLPFLGFLIYLIARRPPGAPIAPSLSTDRPRRRRETKLKVPANGTGYPEDRSGQTIPSYELDDEARLSYENTVPMEVQRTGSVISQFSVLAGPDQGRQFMIDRFPAQIGRELDSAIRLEQDTSVSRKHALVYQVNGSLRVRDLNSRHGTRVNGQPVDDQALQPGDSIEIGGTRLQYQRIDR